MFINHNHYEFKFVPYQRRFRQPLITGYGKWAVREGIIIRLRDTYGRVGWGEIAPLPWFGSETLEQALQFCCGLAGEISQETIRLIPDSLPSCQFAFESAWEELELSSLKVVSPPTKTTMFLDYCEEKGINSIINIDSSKYSYLLSAGEKGLQQWQDARHKQITTLKWKIGVYAMEQEMSWFRDFTSVMPPNIKLRLDANGSLTLSEAIAWLELLEEESRVEYLEQPLPPSAFFQMLELATSYYTPLALDESVSNLQQLQHCYQRGWRGVFVIKPAIAGFPSRLRHFMSINNLDLVFSSVLETNIGTQAVLKLAQEFTSGDRSLGFGVTHWFNEDNELWLQSLLQKF